MNARLICSVASAIVLVLSGLIGPPIALGEESSRLTIAQWSRAREQSRYQILSIPTSSARCGNGGYRVWRSQLHATAPF